MNQALRFAQALLPNTMDRAEGPDLSHWDGGFDPTQASEQIDFAFMKLTEGDNYTDPAVDLLWAGVKQVTVRGGYHYQRSGQSWRLQADLFLKVAAKCDFHIFALDVENLNNIYSDSFFSDTRRIIDYWRSKAPGKKVALYTNFDTYKQLYAAILRLFPDGAEWLAGVAFWYAWPSSILTNPMLPAMRSTWDFWQKSWTGTSAQWGTQAAADVNVFNGTRAQLLQWIGIADQPAPDPEPEPLPRIEPLPETQLFEARVVSLSRVYVRNFPQRQGETETGLMVGYGETFSGYLWPGNEYLWLKIAQAQRQELLGKWIAVRKLDGSGVLVRLTKPLPPPNTNQTRYRVRIYGDPIMVREAGLDINLIHTSNFQNAPLYNKANHSFGAVSNFLRIPHADVLRLNQLQVEDEYIAKQADWRKQKMNWLCQYRGTIYMFDNEGDQWQSAASIRWGTLKLGHNVVSVEDEEQITVQVPGEKSPRKRRMMRLAGFHKRDWDRPLPELLALGLVDRCYCVYKNNTLGDSPKGIIYSPFWSPQDWDFVGPTQPEAFYLPYEWLAPL